MIDQNLRFLRKSHHYSQEEVAEKIQVSRQAVAKWENGDSLPDIQNCMKLAKLYNVSLDDLVNHKDPFEGALLPPKGKHLFGVVTVGERGQIVLPKKARELYQITAGESLLLLGDEVGLALLKNQDIVSFAHAIIDSIQDPSHTRRHQPQTYPDQVEGPR